MEYYSEKEKKKKTANTHNRLDESTDNYDEWKKPTPKGCILYDSTQTTFLKRQDNKHE